MPYRYLSPIVFCLAFSACALTGSDSHPQQLCEQPRPQACTREYVPVCAIKKDKSTGLYGNACSACSNPEVEGYNKGACPQS